MVYFFTNGIIMVRDAMNISKTGQHSSRMRTDRRSSFYSRRGVHPTPSLLGIPYPPGETLPSPIPYPLGITYPGYSLPPRYTLPAGKDLVPGII